MRYKSLVGVQLQTEGFNYWYTSWTEGNPANKSRGASLIKIVKHEICNERCPFYGVECVYEAYGGYFFIYPITELERLGRIPPNWELNNVINYQIY